MQPARIVTLVGGGAFLIAWMAAAAVDPAGHVGREATPTTAGAASDPAASLEPQVADLLSQARRLRARLDRLPRAVATVRNPFSFDDRPIPHAAGETAGLPPTSAASPARRGAPRWRLIGIAESHTADGVVRTAILSGVDGTLLVTAGDDVTPAYRVAAVGVDVVELVGVDGTAITLAFE